MQATARQLGQNLRMPGFRKGKVPPPVVIQRIGRESVLDETVRGAMGRWYLDAIDAAGIHPVGDPELDVGDLPGEGQPLTFTIEIGVRPTATLGEYKGVEVGKREAGADDEAVDAELEALRERSARLETAEDAAAGGRRLRGHGLRRLHRRRDLRRRRGARPARRARAPGASCPASRSSSRARKAGDERTVTVSFPDDYGAAELAGKEAQFAVTVKEIKRKDLPGARRRLRLRRRRLRHARRAARGHHRQAARGRRVARGGRVPRGRARRRRRATRRSRCRRRWSTPAPRSCGSACCTRSATRASTRRPTCGSPGARRPRSSRRPSPTPSRRCAARP